jgi:hypothetical protein
MKEVIMIMDEDPTYSKRFCNQANKLLGKKYTFLTFANLKLMRKYAEENKVESLVVSDNFIENMDDVKVKSFYILNEKEKKLRREGKKSYVYKLQNAKSILDIIDKDLNDKNEKNKGKANEACKLLLYYSPSYIKSKYEMVKKIAKNISKKKKVLVLNLDEFENFKGNVGLSNIIFDYKENIMSTDKLKKEIIEEKEVDLIKSVTYPEDFNVINNIDLANIVNEIVKIGYDFVFVNADMSYVKCQYILNDCDKLIIMRDKNSDAVDKFKLYLKSENIIDAKKITEFNVDKVDRAYSAAFCKFLLSEEEDG